MHVSPAKHSYACLPRKYDYRTDRRLIKWSLCATMLHKWHKNYNNFELSFFNFTFDIDSEWRCAIGLFLTFVKCNMSVFHRTPSSLIALQGIFPWSIKIKCLKNEQINNLNSCSDLQPLFTTLGTKLCQSNRDPSTFTIHIRHCKQDTFVKNGLPRQQKSPIKAKKSRSTTFWPCLSPRGMLLHRVHV